MPKDQINQKPTQSSLQQVRFHYFSYLSYYICSVPVPIATLLSLRRESRCEGGFLQGNFRSFQTLVPYNSLHRTPLSTAILSSSPNNIVQAIHQPTHTRHCLCSYPFAASLPKEHEPQKATVQKTSKHHSRKEKVLQRD